ncbi:helix-turn-helix domain-containing protein [Paenibacillus silvae]|uniref:helix-turn-helix domain-containing protein n=1 Tax=Paenibacillus silvae TaxID=1325358 RepID=UPI0020046FF2|nr:helix-turn-helix domain-containing protein [Paenibacillus silvae]MCK6074659.1 helix-turn-helix domain-containing protein [Paenibacillus silvae]MCK6147866.1 helix-turn-helix domain-containing protein [Paenibacillus silvae]MCK6266164.1 helix-turn-helix domain-containing protein [Paenibacillus silvae]
MPLQEQTSGWSDTAIKMLDGYSGTLQTGSILHETDVTSNVLLLAYGGEGELAMDGEGGHIGASFACHVVKGSSYKLTARSEDIHYIVIKYKASSMEGASIVMPSYRKHPLRRAFVLNSAAHAEWIENAEKIVAKWRRGEGLERFYANALLQGMIYELIMAYERGQGGAESDMVDVVASYIASHYRQDLELKDLAALAGCSVRQLQRRFKQEKQLGPMEYVIQLRMESASRMLRHTDASIGEIADKLGYRDMYYFSRAFKKYVGVPPLHYRHAAASRTDADYSKALLQNRTASSYESAQGPVICHIQGEYTVTETPQRIAVLDVQYADHLLALGLFPIGSVGLGSSVLSFPQPLRTGLQHTELLGTYEYPDLPAVERLAPDLIICTEVHEQYLERLSGIAPVLMFKRNENWQTILSLFGELTGKRAEAKHIIADYLRRTALLSEELASVLAGKSVALIRPLDSLVRVHSAAHRTGAVLYRDLGLPVPLFVADTSDTAYHISVERLTAVQASHYFLLSNEFMQDGISVTEQRVLEMLGGGVEQQVHSVDAATWIGCYGPVGINGIVDQVEQALLGFT